MRASLWAPPHLRTDSERSNAVSWTELFYDLVFVVAVANVGRRFWDESTSRALVEFAVLFGLLWWSWASFTFLVDRYATDDALQRLLAVAQMFGVAGMAAACEIGDRSLETISIPFALSYGLTRLLLLAMYARAWLHLRSSRLLVGGYLRGFGIETAIWFASVVVPPPGRYVLWAVASTLSLATPWLMRRAQVQSPLSASHAPERFGLFTILVLGELVTATVDGLHEPHHTLASAVGAGSSLLIAAGLWWLYFDNAEGSVVRRDATRVHDWRPTAWLYSHLPLALCVTLAGGGLQRIVAAGGDTRGLGMPAVVPASAVGGGLLAMGLIAISSTAAMRYRAVVRVIGAVACLFVATRANALGSNVYLLALAVIVLAQVGIDIVGSLLEAGGAPHKPIEEQAGR